MQADFDIIEELYSSTRTRVYKAVHRASGTRVVVKSRAGAVSDQDHAYLRHENSVLKDLNGPCFVKTIQLRGLKQYPGLIFPDENMDSLAKVIPADGFDLSSFFTIAIGMCRALYELHQANLIHKDINPANFLVSKRRDNVKIIDFEFTSPIFGSRASFLPASSLEGTLAYLPPEQSGRTSQDVCQASDLYSLGISFYQMLTGELPFKSREAKDLIYCHLAEAAPSPSSLRPDLPPQLEEVVLLLLSKAPSQRYQSAEDLADDLELIASHFHAGTEFVGFEPKLKNRSYKLQLSNELFGRAAQREQLLNIFYEISKGPQFVAVLGEGGVGKSALVRELYLPVTKIDGLFLRGKFDQLDQKLAYSAITQIFRKLASHVASRNVAALEKWREHLSLILDNQGQVILDINPDLEVLLGKQPQLIELPPSENQQRLNRVCSDFLNALANAGLPLVLHIDDLQWADPASLDLIQFIMAHAQKNLMIIFSYRESEITVAHPSHAFLERLDAAKQLERKIVLYNLTEVALHEWCADLVSADNDQVEALASQLHLRTAGNAFYVTTFLQQIISDGLIRIDAQGNCQIDIDAIRGLPMDDVVEYLQRSIIELDAREQRLIKHVALLGTEFSADDLKYKLDMSVDDYADSFHRLQIDGLLMKLGKKFIFSHDRIQQAAYELLKPEEAREQHLIIARRQTKRMQDEGPDLVDINQLVRHYNAAADLMVEPDECLFAAQQNLQVAKRYVKKAALLTAEELLEFAINFAPSGVFVSDYEFAVELHTLYGEVLLANHQSEKGAKVLDRVIEHATNPKDRARASSIQVIHLGYHQDMARALEVGTKAIAELGYRFPTRLIWPHVIYNLVKVFWQVRKLSADALIELPENTDPLVEARCDLLCDLIIPSFLVSPGHFMLLFLTLIQTTLKHGLNVGTPVGMAGLSIIFCELGRVTRGYEFGHVAFECADVPRFKKHASPVKQLFLAFVQHRRAPLHDSIPEVQRISEAVQETGDYGFTSWALAYVIGLNLYAGANLDYVRKEAELAMEKVLWLGKDVTINLLLPLYQSVVSLTNIHSDGLTLGEDKASDLAFLAKAEVSDNPLELTLYYLYKAQLAYFSRDADAAIRFGRLTIPRLNSIRGDHYYYIIRFFSALTVMMELRGLSRHSVMRRIVLMREFKGHIKSLESCVDACPENFLAKTKLLQAEYMAYKGNMKKAMKCYLVSIETSTRNANLMEQCIAQECYMRFLFANKLSFFAHQQLQKTLEAYNRWGALKKLKLLEIEFSVRFGAVIDIESQKSVTSSSKQIDSRIDLDALVKSINSLNETLDPTEIQTQLLETVMVNSGATRAVFIRAENGLSVVAEKKIDKASIRFPASTSVNDPALALPRLLIQSAWESSEPYLLTNYTVSENIESSVLILSLQRQERTTSLLYLENSLMPDAFRETQVQFLNLLAKQAAIAMENAEAITGMKQEKDYSGKILHLDPTLICGLDREGSLLFCNPATEQLSGYSEAELKGKQFWETLFPGKDYQQVARMFEQMSQGDLKSHEMCLTTKDGERKDVVFSGFKHKSERDDTSQNILFGIDMTEQNRSKEIVVNYNKKLRTEVDERTRDLAHTISDLQEAQSQLVESEKMAMLGKLVIGVAHNINTPIGVGVTAITHLQDKSANLKLLVKNGELTEKALLQHIETNDRAADLTLSNLQKAAEIVRRFKEISANEISDEKQEFDLNRYLNDAVRHHCAEQSVPFNMVNIDCPESLVIESYPAAFSQIVSQLISNSLSHGFAGSKQGEIKLSVSLDVGTLILKYRDDGSGVDEDVLTRIFDPFFTTQYSTGNVGLGLNLVYNLVTMKLAGTIDCHNCSDRGLCYTIELPMQTNQLNQRVNSASA